MLDYLIPLLIVIAGIGFIVFLWTKFSKSKFVSEVRDKKKLRDIKWQDVSVGRKGKIEVEMSSLLSGTASANKPSTSPSTNKETVKAISNTSKKLVGNKKRGG